MALRNVTGVWDGADLSSTVNFNSASPDELHMSSGDRPVLRELASQVAEYASQPSEKEKRNLWRRHNDLEPTRPVIFCDPENGWNEIITEDNLQCEGSLARRWEVVLRKEIFWAGQMKDDKVIEPYFGIGYTHSEDDWGVQWRQIGGKGGSYVWEAALKNDEDIEKLHPPVFEVDYETTEAAVKLAEDTFGDLLDVRLKGIWWWSFGLTLQLSLWRGLEQIMLDMIDRPQLIHRLMTVLRDGYLQKLDYLEDNGLLSMNTDCYVGSGGFGYTNQLPGSGFDGTVKTQNMWGFCESQETVGISPDMFAEFVYPYQLPFLNRFGLNCYGCCEPLDVRWHVVKNTPNLRRVSVSSWAGLKKMASLLEDKYVFSWKPSPSDLAEPHIDEESLSAKIRNALDVTRDCNIEIIMKDNHTIGNNPQNVIRWVQIAKEEADRAWG